MNLEIKIGKKDIGVEYESIKSLLSKFDEIEKNRDSLKSLKITIQNFDEQIYNELSFSIIWRYLLHFNNLTCKKQVIAPKFTEKYFAKRHFFDRITGKKGEILSSDMPIHYESFTPIRPSKNSNSNIEINKIISSSMKNILDEKIDFHGELKVQILEILANTFDHSNREVPAGSIFVKNDEDNFISFCTIDMGKGMKKSFLDNPFLKNDYIKLQDQEVIEKATNFKISCNPQKQANPNYSFGNAGLGLYFLRKFAELHKGSSLIIISNKGYLYLDSNGKIKQKNFLITQWPGTIVYLKTKLRKETSPEYRGVTKNYLDYFNNLDIV